MRSISKRLPEGKREKIKQSAELLHQLGPLALSYFIIEVAEGRDIDEALTEYAALDLAILRVVGADSFDAEATAQAAALAYVPPRGQA